MNSIVQTILRAGIRATIEKPEKEKGVTGSIRITGWKSSMVEVPCWPQDAKSDVRDMFSSIGVPVDSSIFFAENPKVEDGDRIRVKDMFYVVRGVVNVGSLDRLWHVAAKRYS
jgi:hypothetical protein